MNANQLNRIVETTRIKDQQREAEWRRTEEEYRKQIQIERETRKTIESKCRPATIEDYKKWLQGFLESGGIPTHVYDYEWSRWDWYVVLSDLKLSPLHGANSINLIIPEGIRVEGDPGHTNLFFMDGFNGVGGVIPLFNDIEF